MKLLSLLRRAGWGLADQGFSSLTNFAVGILVARTVAPADFGGFSLAFAGYGLALNVSRALTTQPLVIRFSGPATPEWRRAAGSATGTALLVGIAAGLVALLVATLTAGAVHQAFLTLAILLPGLLLQDAWRFAFFSTARGGHACANDFVWAAVQLPAMALITVAGQASLVIGMAAWGAGAVVAALVGLVQAKVLPDPRAAAEWWRAHRDLSTRYVVDVITGMGGAQLSLYAVTAIAGLAAVGTLRAGELLLGPLNVLFQGVQLAALPEAVRLFRQSPAALRRLSIVLSTVVAAAVLAWGAFVWLLPDNIGIALLGASWAPAHSVVFLLAIGLAGGAANMGASVGLRAMAAAKRSMNINLGVTGLAVLSESTGAALNGAQGAAAAFAAGAAIGTTVWWRQYLAALRRRTSETDAAGEGRGADTSPLVSGGPPLPPAEGTPAPRSAD